MSTFKYKSSLNKTPNDNTTLTSSSSQPIWCSLTTPSQIARKYASIAPIWCHISRPRQLKKKFASTFHQAQNLLTRQHSKDSSLKTNSSSIGDLNKIDGGIKHGYRDDDDDYDDENDSFNDITYKNTLANANTSKTLSNHITDLPSTRMLNNSSAILSGNGHYDHYDIPSLTNESVYNSLTLKKRDSSLDTKQRCNNKAPDSGLSSTNSYLYGGTFSNSSTSASSSNKWPIANSSGTVTGPSRSSLKSQYSNLDVTSLEGGNSSPSTMNSTELPRRPNKYINSSGASKYSNPGLSISGGSKTERIISKSSKSSPNLLVSNTSSTKESTKDYYVDKYDINNNNNKWNSNNTPFTNSSNPYIVSSNSIANSYIGNNYHSTPYYSTNAGTNNSSSLHQQTNNNDYNNYLTNNYNYPSSSAVSSTINNANREEKWNELDSMLGAQSALLSRLESDFVANRNKLKLNTTAAATSSTSSSSSSTTNLNNQNQTNSHTHSTGSYHQPSSTSSRLLVSSKVTPPKVQTASSLLANKYLSLNNSPSVATNYLTSSNTSAPNTKNYSSNNSVDLDSLINGYTNRYRTPTSKRYTSKYTTSKLDDELSNNTENDKKVEETSCNPFKTNNENNTANTNKKVQPTLSTAKTEPLIDLIKSLELNNEERKKQPNRSLTHNNESDNGISNYNSAISSAEKFNSTTNSNYEDNMKYDLDETIDQIASKQHQPEVIERKQNKPIDVQLNSVYSKPEVGSQNSINNKTDFVDDFIDDYISNTLNHSELLGSSKLDDINNIKGNLKGFNGDLRILK
jgi:hypothetical protein